MVAIHKSRYTDKLVGDAQLLAEIACERMSKKDGKDLPFQFWNTGRWLRDYKLQLRFAHQLLKIYSFEAIRKALDTYQGKRIYSLSAKWLDPIIAGEQEKLDRRGEAKEIQKREETFEKIQENLPTNRKPFGNSSLAENL